MNRFKDFLKDKTIYLVCLSLVFAATVMGIVAIRSAARSMSELTQQEDNAWQGPDAAVTNPVTDVPEPTPAASPKASAQPSDGAASSAASSSASDASGAGSASAASAAQQAASQADFWRNEPLAPFSGDELVYNETLGDWRTHNGADYALAAGSTVTPAAAGNVVSVWQDALWGWCVEVAEKDGTLWRVCGLADAAVQEGDAVTLETPLGTLGDIPAEAHESAHLHVECTRNDTYLDPETEK